MQVASSCSSQQEPSRKEIQRSNLTLPAPKSSKDSTCLVWNLWYHPSWGSYFLVADCCHRGDWYEPYLSSLGRGFYHSALRASGPIVFTSAGRWHPEPNFLPCASTGSLNEKPRISTDGYYSPVKLRQIQIRHSSITQSGNSSFLIWSIYNSVLEENSSVVTTQWIDFRLTLHQASWSCHLSLSKVSFTLFSSGVPFMSADIYLHVKTK